MAPIQNTIMFIIMVWATFFARVKPVSTSAKPACIKKTRKAASITHRTLRLVVVSLVVAATVFRSGRVLRQRHTAKRQQQGYDKKCIVNGLRNFINTISHHLQKS